LLQVKQLFLIEKKDMQDYLLSK